MNNMLALFLMHDGVPDVTFFDMAKGFCFLVAIVGFSVIFLIVGYKRG